MKLETAESVTMGHPDKAADYVADCVLDACLTQDKNSKVACEVLLSHNSAMVAGEISTKAKLDLQNVVTGALLKIYGTIPSKIWSDIVKQSPDINQAVGDGEEQGAGDQGIVYGYATNETITFMPPAVNFARSITNQLNKKMQELNIGPDGKSQVTIERNDDGTFKGIKTIIVSVQHPETMGQSKLKEIVTKKIIEPLFEEYDLTNTEILINPSGKFVVGGYKADTGLTGRKLMVDTYGGLIHHGGGAMSGKDASKVDRSGALMARWVAKTIIYAKLCDEVEVGIAYAIGKAQPVMVSIDTKGTWRYVKDKYIAEAVKRVFDFRPNSIADALDLRKPIYANTAINGAFGGNKEPWEQVSLIKCEQLKAALKEIMHEN